MRRILIILSIAVALFTIFLSFSINTNMKETEKINTSKTSNTIKPNIFYTVFYFRILNASFLADDVSKSEKYNVYAELNSHFKLMFWLIFVICNITTILVMLACYFDFKHDISKKTMRMYSVFFILFCMCLYAGCFFLANLGIVPALIGGLVFTLIAEIIIYHICKNKILPVLLAIDKRKVLIKTLERKYDLIKTQTVWNQ